MLYTSGRIATPRGRQWCKDCRPEQACDQHPFVPGVDRWTHDPHPWLRDEAMDALHARALTAIPIGKACDCTATTGDGDFICTLDAGHPGLHAAHGVDEVFPIVTWPRDEPKQRIAVEILDALRQDQEPAAECAECRGGCDSCETLTADYAHPGTGRRSVFRLRRWR